jgi:hypothetical protein
MTWDDSACSIGGLFQIQNDTKLKALYLREGETDMVWALHWLNVDDATPHIIWFKIPIKLLSPLSMIKHGLYDVLGGDIKFLNIILGLQVLSAAYPCFV